MKSEYSCPLDQCDIQDKEKGEVYRQLRVRWTGWLIGTDPHAISRQIHTMLWDYALFLLSMRPEESPAMNLRAVAV